MINFWSSIFYPVKRASTFDLASELNHDDHIYDEDAINVAPNDSNWGARPIRSLQEEQSKSFLDDLTFSLDKQRVVCCRSPLRRRYDTNFDYNWLLDEVERAHERAEERDKKWSGLVVDEYQPSLWELRAWQEYAVAAVAAVSALLREGRSEGKQAVGRRGSSEMHFVD